MNIHIHIKTDSGETLFKADTLSIDSAIAELGRFERNQEREKLAEIEMDDQHDCHLSEEDGCDSCARLNPDHD